MKHFTLDAHLGWRSRLADTNLMFEVMAELATKLGLQPAMPAIVLPYWDGIAPDDCGISAMMLLVGGHIAIHTFSYRECMYADIACVTGFDEDLARRLLLDAFPARAVVGRVVDANTPSVAVPPKGSFGPHLMLEFAKAPWADAADLETVFTNLEALPPHFGMTPITRAVVARSKDTCGNVWVSGILMIAESHIAVHICEATNESYFDIFSCKWFDAVAKLAPVTAWLGLPDKTHLIARGESHDELRTERNHAAQTARAWEAAIPV